MLTLGFALMVSGYVVRLLGIRTIWQMPVIGAALATAINTESVVPPAIAI